MVAPFFYGFHFMFLSFSYLRWLLSAKTPHELDSPFLFQLISQWRLQSFCSSEDEFSYIHQLIHSIEPQSYLHYLDIRDFDESSLKRDGTETLLIEGYYVGDIRESKDAYSRWCKLVQGKHEYNVCLDVFSAGLILHHSGIKGKIAASISTKRHSCKLGLWR